MALSAHDAFAAGGGSRRRRGRARRGMQDEDEPLTVSIRRDGAIYIGETPVPFAGMAPRLQAMAGGAPRPIYVRADGQASYETVAQVMAALSTSGFTSINLITDTGGPSSGGEPEQP